MRLSRPNPLRASLIAAAALCTVHGVHAQNLVPHFSVSWHGPTVGTPDSLSGLPITEGDVLVPPAPSQLPQFGPAPAPAIFAKAGPFGGVFPPHLGLAAHPLCMGHPGGTPCRVEVDALCDGQSLLVQPNFPINSLYFSTDKYAFGFGAPIPPSTGSEAPIGESQADVMVNFATAAGPAAPFVGPLVGHTAALDGDGMMGASAFLYRGVGLREPSLPGPMLPDTGDNLDALMLRPMPTAAAWPPFGVFFSLDSAFADPLTGLPNTGSALAHGFQGADILNTPAASVAPVLYCPAPVQGLDFFGPGTDDLDALVVCENGVAGYQPAPNMYGWLAGADMVLFSVRRGSAVIGMPDSVFGLPICEGDILVRPIPGGLSPFPAIFIAAENLGLATTRSHGVAFSDELDALDMPTTPLFDCNGNGREDALDVRFGTSLDTNNNGIPDECEAPLIATPFCFCPAPLGPCGNNDAGAGCRNSSGVGALLSASGSTSVGLDDLVLTTTQMPTFKQCMMIMSANMMPPAPFFDGRRCLQGPLARFAVSNSGASGTLIEGPGLAAYSSANFPVFNWITAGSIFGFQTWYRDGTGPCGQGSNLSSAIKATFVP
ncbi:MAG: hypothetical protein IT454_07095 [Planctomycetes bacterium]|nr:hypothetical protein [Planctomycetota bacterium]